MHFWDFLGGPQGGLLGDFWDLFGVLWRYERQFEVDILKKRGFIQTTSPLGNTKSDARTSQEAPKMVQMRAQEATKRGP